MCNLWSILTLLFCFSFDTSPAFAFFTTILSQYVDHIVHHIVKNSQYCHHIVIMLSTYCDNIVHHIVSFHNTVNIYGNRMWSQYGWNFTIWWTILSGYCDVIVAENAKAGNCSSFKGNKQNPKINNRAYHRIISLN